MTITNTASLGERVTAFAVFATVVVLFAFYGSYFVRTLVPLSTEQAALALGARGLLKADIAYAMVLALWGMIAGHSLVAARTLSLLAAVAVIVLVFRIGRKLTGDGVTAAFLTLSFILFPPLVATLVSATPHALVLLLALAALDLILSGSRAAHFNGVLAGVLAALAVLLVPLGAVLVPLWLMLCAALTKQRQSAAIALMVVVVSEVVMLATGIHAPVIDVDLAAVGHNTLFTALMLPYAMVPVTIILGAFCVFSPTVRHVVGLDRALAVLCAPLGMFVVLWLAVVSGGLTVGHLVTAMGYGFAFAIFAPWPLIVWVKRVMPQVKSLGAWIVFPVIMYSSFWVILGPIDPGKFPYSHRQILQPVPPDQRL